MDSEVLNGEYPNVKWNTSLDIPLKDSEEVVSIDLVNDLPEDPSDLKTLLVEENSDKEHWLTIAIAYSQRGLLKECISLVQMALEVFQGPQSAALHTCLTWAFLKQAKKQLMDYSDRDSSLVQAEHHLKEAIGYDPSGVGNMLATIDLYYQRRQYDKALETSELFLRGIHAEDQRLGRLSKPNVLFLLVRAKLFYQKKNYTVSLRLFQELLVLNPVLKPDSRIGIGMCFWQLKDYEMALRAWKRSLKLAPENPNVKILLLLGEFHMALSNSEDDESFKKQFTAALEQLGKLMSSNKQNPVLLVLCQTYCYLKFDFEKVIEIHEKQIAPFASGYSNTVVSESAFWCGRAYYALNEPRKAFLLFQESLKSDEDNFLARFGLGQTQIKNNLIEESILTFENLYATHENIQEINYTLGLLHGAKCLDSKTWNSTAPAERNKLLQKSIDYLEKYIKLTKAKRNQIVVVRAYLMLSELYQLQNEYKTSLEVLSRAIDQLQAGSENVVPIEIYNNLGCLHFINGDRDEAHKYFEQASKLAHSAKEEPASITIQFNSSRVFEYADPEKALHSYENLLAAHPSYIHAKIRYLYLMVMKSKSEKLDSQADELLEQHPSDLDARSFYTWFLKNGSTQKKSEKTEGLETNHNRDTLTKYDSHDSYALLSLANLYVIIARESKKLPSAKEQDKSRQSFMKAIQLLQKVLQVDPFNIFAAQGLAIIYAENKRFGPCLEILRKVRDSLNNESVHINLGHCLLEMQEHSKAIENYEIALKQFTNETSRPLLLNLLGRAWYSRGVKEKSLECYEKSLEYAQEALAAEQQKENSTMLQSIMFNVALLHFQVAETLRRTLSNARTLDQLENATKGLKTASNLLKQLIDQGTTIMPIDELDQRLQLSDTTMKTALERCITEQKDHEAEVAEKLANARKAFEEGEVKEREQRMRLEQQERERIAKQTEEYNKLQEEARKLMDERSEMDSLEHVKESNPPLSGDEEFQENGDGKKKKRAKRTKKAEDGKAASKKRGRLREWLSMTKMKTTTRTNCLVGQKKRSPAEKANRDTSRKNSLMTVMKRMRGLLTTKNPPSLLPLTAMSTMEMMKRKVFSKLQRSLIYRLYINETLNISFVL
ncbi:LAME_0C09296g1_1 [Lachancea meyersii CBS 8951]|uniref:LAME_0C09296g1_1 n=1 Tax=Lachancea meyersii CBS 8951 TaxID=1266667 RepID=A0A1G4J3S2_9SACH|nr:LAME_0C09296g1_1 [Lachancea meyersii CBS 8951]